MALQTTLCLSVSRQVLGQRSDGLAKVVLGKAPLWLIFHLMTTACPELCKIRFELRAATPLDHRLVKIPLRKSLLSSLAAKESFARMSWEGGGGVLVVRRVRLVVRKMALLTEAAKGKLTSKKKHWRFNRSLLQRDARSAQERRAARG